MEIPIPEGTCFKVLKDLARQSLVGKEKPAGYEVFP